MDTRNPAPSTDVISRVMRSNKGKATGPELMLRKELRRVGLSGYRLNWKKVPGRPDIAYPGRKVAIFVNGCFWHRCPRCNLPLPKSHTEFWKAKFDRNVERDQRKTSELLGLGWTVITVWECEIRKDVQSVSRRISEIIRGHP